MKREQIVITKEDGTDEVAEILFTYEANDKKYVIFEFLANGEISAARYNEDGENTGTLSDIETEAEWEMLDEVLNAYFDDLDADEDDLETEEVDE